MSGGWQVVDQALDPASSRTQVPVKNTFVDFGGASGEEAEPKSDSELDRKRKTVPNRSSSPTSRLPSAQDCVQNVASAMLGKWGGAAAAFAVGDGGVGDGSTAPDCASSPTSHPSSQEAASGVLGKLVSAAAAIAAGDEGAEATCNAGEVDATEANDEMGVSDAVAGGVGARQPSTKRAKPGRRERQEMKLSSERNSPARITAAFGHALGARMRDGHVAINTGMKWVSKFFEKVLQIRVGPSMLILAAVVPIVAVLFHQRVLVGNVGPSAGAIMTEHSEVLLNQSRGNIETETSIAALHDKLQFSRMQMDLDTQVFTATRETVQNVLKSVCDLPEKMCASMVAAAAATDAKFHKKKSIPLDENTGSYLAVWMWVKAAGNDDEVQVAFKAASLSYQLRDVVTYQDQVEEEPVVKCEVTAESGFFWTTRSERCHHISTKKIVTPIPVFKQAVMNPQEMALVDTMMERMLAKKVLENQQMDGSRGLEQPTAAAYLS